MLAFTLICYTKNLGKGITFLHNASEHTVSIHFRKKKIMKNKSIPNVLQSQLNTHCDSLKVMIKEQIILSPPSPPSFLTIIWCSLNYLHLSTLYTGQGWNSVDQIHRSQLVMPICSSWESILSRLYTSHRIFCRKHCFNEARSARMGNVNMRFLLTVFCTLSN